MPDSNTPDWEPQEALDQSRDLASTAGNFLGPHIDKIRLDERVAAMVGAINRQQSEQWKSISAAIEGYSASSAAMNAARKMSAITELPFGQTAARLLSITADAERYSKLLRNPLENLHLSGSIAKNLEVFKVLENAAASQKLYEGAFRIPAAAELSQLAASALSSKVFSSSILGRQDFIADIQSKMEGMRNPWLNINSHTSSAQAFAEIQAIGRLVSSPSPFGESISASLRIELGDWRDHHSMDPELLVDSSHRTNLYVERGFNQALTAFTVAAFDEGLESAGMRERAFENSSGDDSGLEVEEGVARNRDAYETLLRFEITIRQFILEVMHSYYGDGWMKSQIPGPMLEGWRDKEQKALKAGAAQCELIEYADFTDYRTIIERNDNWNAIFQSVFGRKEDVRESFQRLFPVRIATMHSRILTLDDELYLRSETRRLLSAVRKVSRARI